MITKNQATIAAGIALLIALAALVVFATTGGDDVALIEPEVTVDRNGGQEIPDVQAGIGSGDGTATTLSSNGLVLQSNGEDPTAQDLGPAIIDGFPTTEPELASFLRGAASSFQLLAFQGSQGGSGQGDPSSTPSRFIDLRSAEAIANAQRPSSSLQISEIVTGNGPQAANPNDYNRGQNGVFHVACTVSHFAYDDPIAIPGQPGRAHLHMFFGNTQANAFSTTDSILNSGNSSCQHEELNRTAYWVPALLDGDDHALVPDYIQVYYESLADKTNLERFPEGLRFISGNAFATAPQDQINFRGASFFCGWYSSASNDGSFPGSAANHGQTIPDCDPNRFSHMQVNLATPYCWNGELEWSSSNPNVIYPEQDRGPCPASHSTQLPHLYYRMTFDLTESPTRSSTWYLSSDIDRDTGERRGPAGSSLHADWWNGWNDPLLESIFDNCINRENRWCGPVHLGDGRLTDHVGKAQGVDDARISPEEILTTCPLRDSYDGNPRNIAYCAN